TGRRSRPSTSSATCRSVRRCGGWCERPRVAGGWNTVTRRSRTSWAWTTSRAGGGGGGSTTGRDARWRNGLRVCGGGGGGEKGGGARVTLPQVLREMQYLLLCWAGVCPVCGRPVASEPPEEDTG